VKKTITALMAAGLMAALPMAAMASDGAENGPATINLKEKFNVEGSKKAVIFPHRMHQEKLACTKCHPTDKGGPLKVEIKKTKGFGNDFHKNFCWPCHVEMKVPKGKSCGTCHK